MNSVTLFGRLGSDPESRFTPAGSQIVNFTLATSRRWKDKQTGEKKESTQWHNITLFGTTAKIAADYVKKGERLLVTGEIEYQSWEKDGQKHYKTVILGNNIVLIEGRGNESKPTAKQEKASVDFEDSDIPF